MRVKRVYTTPPVEADLRQKADRRRAALEANGCATYVIGQRGPALGIVCLCCGLGSSEPHDLVNRYCGFCARYHAEWSDPPTA